ncbi:zinc transporter ZIP3-like [Ostrea edulis]|uniref:zinc transporter ZIP3-like n=1 Tax=Ostrea edulis TaxID=37623 RepID=UPI0024AFCEBB|nr:zinc transporter ZIP3-like [Ostrea edulis]
MLTLSEFYLRKVNMGPVYLNENRDTSCSYLEMVTMNSGPKVISIFVLLFATFIIGVLPHGLLKFLKSKFSRSKRYQRCITILNCFAGGVFFATTILHLIPESTELLEGVFTMKYPVSGALSGAGFFLLLFIEHLIGCCRSHTDLNSVTENIEVYLNDTEISNGTSNGGIENKASETMSNKTKSTRPGKETIEMEAEPQNIIEQEKSTLSKLRALVLLLAFSFHMIFEGLALGLERTDAGVWSLLGILALHKCVVAFSVGLQLSESLQTLKSVLLSLLAFSVVAPVGVVIGFLVTEYGDGGLAQKIAAGVLQSLATGTFFYVTFFEILQKELTQGYNLYNVLYTVVGFSTVIGVEFFHDSE